MAVLDEEGDEEDEIDDDDLDGESSEDDTTTTTNDSPMKARDAAIPLSFEDLPSEDQLALVAQAFTREQADSMSVADLCENVNSQLLLLGKEACTKYLLLHLLYSSKSVS